MKSKCLTCIVCPEYEKKHYKTIKVKHNNVNNVTTHKKTPSYYETKLQSKTSCLSPTESKDLQKEISVSKRRNTRPGKALTAKDIADLTK